MTVQMSEQELKQSRIRRLRTTILYQIGVNGERIPWDLVNTDDRRLVEKQIDALRKAGLIEIEGADHYVLTKEGHAELRRQQEIFDLVVKFDVFHRVDFGRELTEDESQDDDGHLVNADQLDPRFPQPGDENCEVDTVEDLRLAALVWSCKRNGLVVDPYEVVFSQKLRDDKFRTKGFWFEVNPGCGVNHGDVEDIVDNAYQWQWLAGPVENFASEAERDAISDKIMEGYFRDGMIEARKRAGQFCDPAKGGCGTILAEWEDEAKENGETLSECPNPQCKKPLNPTPPKPEEAEYVCDNCQDMVYASQRRCHGCGHELNFSLPTGTVKTVTETDVERVTHEVWDDGYAYDRRPLAVDVALCGFALGCLVGVAIVAD